MQVATLPRQDQPLEVQRLQLQAPRVLLISGKQGGFVGWTRLLGQEQKSTTHPVAHPGAKALPFILRAVQIRDGELAYDANDGSPRMTLPGISSDLGLSPSAGEPGWYSLAAGIHRQGGLNLDVQARIHPDRSIIDLQQFRLTGELNDKQYQLLPPQVQQGLRGRQVRGALEAQAQAFIPLNAVDQTRGTLTATLRNAHFTADQTTWPIDSVQVQATAQDSRIRGEYKAALLGGRADGQISVGLAGTQPLDVSWQVADVRLENTLRVIEQSTPKYAGLLASQGRLTGQLQNWPASIGGQGTARVTEGRLIYMPVIRHLVSTVLAAGIVPSSNDQGRADWTFMPDHLQVASLEVKSSVVTVTGRGQIYYDGRLNMDMSTAPLQLPAGNLGRVGNLIEGISQISSKVVVYDVRGTLNKPEVGARPLGIRGR